MSQLLETDFAVNRGVQLLFADTNRRVTQLEQDQLRLLDMMEKMIELDKTRAEAFGMLHTKVNRFAVHCSLQQQAIDALHARIEKLERSMTNESVI